MSAALQAMGRLASRPLVIAGSVLLGVLAGWLLPAQAADLHVVSEVYLALLKMIVLPFMVSAIVVSLYRLLRQGQAGRLLLRMTGLFVVAMGLCVMGALLASLLVHPGHGLSADTLARMGNMVDSSTSGREQDQMALFATGEDEAAAPAPSFAGMLGQLVPDNIFSVLARGEALKALVFALLFGCALSRIAVAAADVLASSLEAVFHVCQMLTKWFNLFLPIVLFGMIASQIARSGVESLQAMSGFLATLMVALLLLLLGATWTIVHVSARPWRQVLAAQRECLSMALATQNTQACMPAMMDALGARLGFPRHRVEFLVPLSVSLLRSGQAAFFIIVTFFVANLYGRELGAQEVFIVLVGAVLTALASTGMSGLLVLALAGVVCNSLALPFDAAMALLVVVEPLSDAFRTVTTVAVGNAWTAAACGRPAPAAAPSAGGLLTSADRPA